LWFVFGNFSYSRFGSDYFSVSAIHLGLGLGLDLTTSTDERKICLDSILATEQLFLKTYQLVLGKSAICPRLFHLFCFFNLLGNFWSSAFGYSTFSIKVNN